LVPRVQNTGERYGITINKFPSKIERNSWVVGLLLR
jgi:hypothetical protein